MYEITDLFREGGEFMYLVLMLAVPGMLLGAILAITTSLGHRVPAAVWLVFPLTVIGMGAVGAWAGTELASKAIGSASNVEIQLMASMGYAIARYPDGLGLFLGAFLLTITALCGGIATTVGSGEGARWQPAAGIAIATAALVIAAGLGLWTFGQRTAPGPLLIPTALALGGLGCGLGALRTPAGEDGEQKAAAARLFLGFCAVGGVLCAVALGELSGDSTTHRALATAAPEMRLSLAWSGRTTAETASLLGWIAVPAMIALAAIPAVPRLGHLANTRTLVSGAVALVLFVPLGAARLAGASGRADLFEWTVLARMQALPGHLDDLPHAKMPEGLQPTWLGERSSWWTLELTSDGWTQVHTVAGLTPALPLEPGRGPVLLVPATTPASILAEARLDQDGQVDLLLRLDPAAPTEAEGWPTALVTLELELVPRGQPLVDLELQRRTFDPELHRHVARERDGVDALASLREQDASAWHQLVLVPGAGWTAQDVVTLCLAARSLAGHDGSSEGGRWLRCTLAAEVPQLAGTEPEPDIEPSQREQIDAAFSIADLERSHIDPNPRPHVDPQPIKGGVSHGTLETDGQADGDRQAIVRTMRRYSGRFKACYERQLRVQQQLAGRVTLEFEIEPSGRVTSAGVSASTLADPELEECLVSAIKHARFVGFEGTEPVTVSYPLVFSTR